LMVTAQVTDKEYYAELVSEEQIGFSIEGYLGMKLSEQTNKNQINMNKLPDGEHLIEGKIYVVKDGEVIEIKEVEKVEASEEVALEDTVVEEESTVETTEEETMAVDPELDAEAVLAIVKPAIEEQVNQLVAMIADLQNQLDQALTAEVEEEVEMAEAVALSVQQRFSNVNKFINK